MARLKARSKHPQINHTNQKMEDWGQPAETGPTLRSHAAMVLGSRIAVVWFGG